jgi:ABC-type polysaccharide/polyol phosphate export permease
MEHRPNRHRQSSRAVWTDLRRGAHLWPFWLRLGFDDIRARYARTALGPLWLLIKSGTWIFVMSLINSALFGQSMGSAAPYVAAGMCSWLILASILTESCDVFLYHGCLLTASSLPASFHLYRHLVRVSITFVQYMPIMLGVLAIRGIYPSVSLLGLVPVMVMYLALAVWTGTLMGIFTLYVRDTPHLLHTVIPLIPIVSPLMWSRDMLKQHQWVADLNPVYHYVEILRSVALHAPLPWSSWVTVAGVNTGGLVVAFVVYRRTRGRLGLLI